MKAYNIGSRRDILEEKVSELENSVTLLYINIFFFLMQEIKNLKGYIEMWGKFKENKACVISF